MDSNYIIDDGIIVWFDGPEWDEVAAAAFERASDQILAAAQSDAPWADRTGAARSGLDVTVDSNGGEITLDLFHTVDYGLWLEVIQNGRFATIMPTLERYAPQIFADASAEVREARKGDDL